MIVTLKTKDDKGNLHIALVDTQSREFLGKCKISPIGNLSNVVVNPQRRGEGLANRIMQAALNNGRIPVVSLKVKPSKGTHLTFRQTSDFYAKHGFRAYDDSPMRARTPSIGELDRAGFWVA